VPTKKKDEERRGEIDEDVLEIERDGEEKSAEM
jgi:hypothetical protein